MSRDHTCTIAPTLWDLQLKDSPEPQALVQVEISCHTCGKQVLMFCVEHLPGLIDALKDIREALGDQLRPAPPTEVN
jgi:hypothetical protein